MSKLYISNRNEDRIHSEITVARFSLEEEQKGERKADTVLVLDNLLYSHSSFALKLHPKRLTHLQPGPTVNYYIT